jgi:hypothetical protein
MLVRGRYTKHYKGEDMPHYIFSARKSDESLFQFFGIPTP